MNLNVFVTIICIITILQVVMLVLQFPIVSTIKAGDKDDYHFRYRIKKHTSNYVKEGNRLIDVSQMSQYVVAGNSMRNYNIYDGQTIYLQNLTEQEVLLLQEYPVLAYHLEKSDKTKCLDSVVKLRKFVSFLPDMHEDAVEVYNRLINRINDFDQNIFIQEYNERRNMLHEEDPNFEKNYILSVTYSERLGRNHYSIHAADKVQGVVKYVC